MRGSRGERTGWNPMNLEMMRGKSFFFFFSHFLHIRASNSIHCSNWGVKLVQICLLELFSVCYSIFVKPSSGSQEQRSMWKTAGKFRSLHRNVTAKSRWRGYFRHHYWLNRHRSMTGSSRLPRPEQVENWSRLNHRLMLAAVLVTNQKKNN